MLLHTDLSVAQVAAKCGFQSASHFSVKFKKQYKESPSSWRQLGSII
ncbi:MAG: AraC family transcriptional regulator [Clostridia bacterium]|nr:AraC family transcriptional regulator [Clostridia bacterium]MBQ8371343.1 AraC family transcriptional regulator [Clostridia bacterium]